VHRQHSSFSRRFCAKKGLVSLSRLGAEDSQAVVILVNIDSSFIRRFCVKKGLVSLPRLGAEVSQAVVILVNALFY
jgi:hypothetical protein